jgi:hypothetical protein
MFTSGRESHDRPVGKFFENNPPVRSINGGLMTHEGKILKGKNGRTAVTHVFDSAKAMPNLKSCSTKPSFNADPCRVEKMNVSCGRTA